MIRGGNGSAHRKRKQQSSETQHQENEANSLKRQLQKCQNPRNKIASIADLNSLLSDDLVRHVFQFLAASGKVDVSSVQSILQVSKRFSKVAGGRHLWRMAAHSNESGNATPLPITDSLHIRAQNSSQADDLGKEITCLAGFVNLGEIHQSEVLCLRVFEVKERSSGKLCYFVIHEDRYNNRTELVKEVFANHYLMAELFLKEGKKPTRQFRFSILSGVHFLTIRHRPNFCLLQWYDKDESLFQDLDCYRTLRTMQGNDRMIQQVKLLMGESGVRLRHLLRLENAVSQPTTTTRRLRIEHRRKLIDWIVEIFEVFDLDDSALHRAVSFLDRFVEARSTESILTKEYQLITGVCIGIASKCEGGVLSENDICFCADNTFEVSKVREMEDAILLSLDWKLAFPTLLDFLNEYEQLNKSDSLDKSFWMKMFLSELTLQCPVSFNRRPSIVAACIVSLAAYLTEGQQIWPHELEEATGYRWFDLEECMLELCEGLMLVETSMPELSMVKRRYSKQKRARVAQGFIMPHITTFASLTAQRTRRLST